MAVAARQPYLPRQKGPHRLGQGLEHNLEPDGVAGGLETALQAGKDGWKA